LLAEECEAHDGLHVIGEAAIFERRGQELVVTSLLALRKPVLRVLTGLTGEIERGLCPCGRPGERLIQVATKHVAMRKAAGAR
jgi:phenylacetate-coenzyme A ligase PaaK-like adenylate-forming protein